MTPNEYQQLAERTINNELSEEQILRHALFGLAAEVGELLGIYQKSYQGHSKSKEHIIKEGGDILWMLAEFFTINGLWMEDVMKANIDKLNARYPNGFEAEKSLNRKEGDI